MGAVPRFLVFVTGILELAIAAAVLLPKTRSLAGWTAITVLVLFFPANIYAALNHVPMGGHTWDPSYLLIRAPVQVIVALWACWFAVPGPRLFSGRPNMHEPPPAISRRS